VLALTSGIGFAMMAVVFSRRFLPVAALFFLLMLLAPLLPAHQWLLAAAWWLALFVPGLAMHRERRKRAVRGGGATIV